MQIKAIWEICCHEWAKCLACGWGGAGGAGGARRCGGRVASRPDRNRQQPALFAPVVGLSPSEPDVAACSCVSHPRHAVFRAPPATSTRTSTAATRPRRRKLFLLIELCYAVYVCAARWCRYCRQCNIASDSKEEETATTITTFVRLIVVLRVPLVYSKWNSWKERRGKEEEEEEEEEEVEEEEEEEEEDQVLVG